MVLTLKTSLVPIIFLLLLNGYEVFGVDLNSFIPRTDCYLNEQSNCNEEFLDVYKNLSKSATGLTDADTWFFLFTRENCNEPEKLHKCGGKLPPNSKFDPSKRLYVNLVSFLVGYCDIAAFRELTAQLLKREDCNVLVVDYSWGNRIDISTVYINGELVADQTAIVLKNIQEQTGITKDKIHLFGFSLGAQVAGLIGYRFPVYRITGIDPGGGAYKEDLPLAHRLDRTDADLVDIWHTGMGECLPNLSINYPAGHVDYYVNGGFVQNNCLKYAFKSISKGDLLYGFGMSVYPQLCWHCMAPQYFKASINPGNCQFVGVECDSYVDYIAGRCRSCGRNGEKCVIAGLDVDRYYSKNITQFPKKYYFSTSDDCPWCDNRGIRLEGFSRIYRASLKSAAEEKALQDNYSRFCPSPI